MPASSRKRTRQVVSQSVEPDKKMPNLPALPSVDTSASLDACYGRIREILTSARASLARTVNTTQVVSYWLIGREIVNQELHGKERAEYGAAILSELAVRMTAEFGRGYSARHLRYLRQFYIEYPRLIDGIDIWHTPCAKSGPPGEVGTLNPNLSWSHYRLFLTIEAQAARRFYETEAARNSWSVREVERQIGSQLYERLAQGRDKEGTLRLALQGQEVQRPIDVFKDPLVLEFTGLPSPPALNESTLEQAIIDNLQKFMLELGVGFAFIGRQQRFTIDGDHFYVDLVLYHIILRCFVLVELKIGKFEPRDVGQLQLYVNYYDAERRSAGDNPTLGLILCTDKNDAVVRYTLGNDKDRMCASRYQMHLPTVEQLEAEVRRELRFMTKPTAEEREAALQEISDISQRPEQGT